MALRSPLLSSSFLRSPSISCLKIALAPLIAASRRCHLPHSERERPSLGRRGASVERHRCLVIEKRERRGQEALWARSGESVTAVVSSCIYLPTRPCCISCGNHFTLQAKGRRLNPRHHRKFKDYRKKSDFIGKFRQKRGFAFPSQS